jgi:hypothetical protein
MTAELAPLRISTLCQMAKSPAHALYARDHDTPPTAAMRLGSLVHAIALGKNVPVVYPGPARRGKEWEAFKARHPEGEVIYLESELADARAIAGSLVAHPEACSLLMGRREETFTWTNSGRLCRGTPDAFNVRENALADLKICVDASPRRFSFAALALAYHAKLTWYADGLEKAGVGRFDRLFLVAAENKPPYAVATYQLTPHAMDFGRRLYRSWLEAFLVCEKSNHWPGYLPGLLDAPEEFALTIGGEELEIA